MNSIAALADYKPKSDGITEDSAALLFRERHVGQLLYDHDAGCWYHWTGSHWQQEKTGLAFDWARTLARDLSSDESSRSRATLQKTSFASGVEKFSQRDRAFAIRSDGWDADPMLLGTPDGTVDLRTGNVRPAKPGDRITKVTAVAPNDFADCSRWLSFLDEATNGDADLVTFLQQFAGYALTGDVSEHALLFGYGTGRNGKSVFINALSGLLGDYTISAPMDTFVASSGDKHPTDLAMLRGARLVTASETEQGRAWAEARIKEITGGDRITARFMRQDFFSYRPQFKLLVVGNHRPILRNVDEAARRRFNFVGFKFKPRKPDRSLSAKLEAEWPGILRWAINGCLDWQRRGLVRPKGVVDETDEYFSAQDLLGQFLSEKCDCDEDGMSSTKSVPVGEAFSAWAAFAKDAGDPPVSSRSFGDAMERRGFPRFRTDRFRLLKGVRVRSDETSHFARQGHDG